MPFDTRPLRHRDDALRLQDLVYTTYGLTYHRSFLYDAERLLDLNARSLIRSMLAIDRDTGAVIGHLAAIRPWFEMATIDEQLQPSSSIEMGLSIVHPERRGQSVQGTLGIACVAYEQSVNPSLRTIFTKCLTRHLMSQRSSRRMGGRAGAMFLGGVPGWVVHDRTQRPQPMTTVLFHVATTETSQRTFLPEKWAGWVDNLLRDSNQQRELVAVPQHDALLPGGHSVLRTWFEPARRRGVIHIREARADLVAEVMSMVGWMAGGHMEHVSVLVPLDTPEVAAVLPLLEDAGLFVGGFLPDLDGRDCLLLQRLACDALDVSDIEVIGDEAILLRHTVLAEWQRARVAVLPTTRAAALAG